MTAEPAELFGLAAAALILAVAVFVLGVRPRLRVNIALATVLAGIGLARLHYQLTSVSTSREDVYVLITEIPWMMLLRAFLWFAAAAGLFLLVVRFPARLGRDGWRGFVLPSLVAVALVVAGTLSFTPIVLARSTSLFDALAGIAEFLATTVYVSAAYGFLILAAYRFRRAAPMSPARRQLALLGTAFALLGVGYGGGVWLVTVARDLAGDRFPFGVAAISANLLTSAVWLAASWRPAPDARVARNVALATLAIMLASMLAFRAGGVARSALGPTSDLAAAAFLAYAVLRHQLLGLDVKVRFAISKSTIAAAFIAVFFIASEAAQQFFGEQFESGYLGILAAGALVFAIAPLSRLADRLAEKAVPVQPSSSTPPLSEHFERYRVLLRRYLRDGQLSRDEEMALAHAAGGMGIPAHEALRLRREVEDERGRG